jgi:hypothetical protein
LREELLPRRVRCRPLRFQLQPLRAQLLPHALGVREAGGALGSEALELLPRRARPCPQT